MEHHYKHLNVIDLAIKVVRHQALAQQFYAMHRCFDVNPPPGQREILR